MELLSVLFALNICAIIIFSFLVTSILLKANYFAKIAIKVKKGFEGKGNLKYRSNFLNKLNMRYLEKSNIKSKLPFINIYFLIGLEGGIFIVSLLTITSYTHSFLSSAAISIFFASMPLILLDFLSNYNTEKTQNDLSSFISVLARWCSVKNDIFFAFEKTCESGLNEPLNTFVKDLIIQIRCGINPIDALDRFSERLGDSEFKDAILNIKQNIRFRGDGSALLNNMESRLYRMQEERNKRKISTLWDRTLIIFIMIGVVLMAWHFLRNNQIMASFYFESPIGKTLLLIFCILFLLGLFMFMKVTKTRG